MDNTKVRRPAGIPTGGQFAATAHAESSVVLGPSPAQIGTMYAQAEKSSRFYADRQGVDYDELLTRMLHEIPLDDPSKYLSEPYIHGTAKKVAARILTGHSNGADFEGDRLYRAAVESHEAALGRSMTMKEKDAMAQQVRQSQPPRRRARIGFHHPHTSVHSFGLQSEILHATEDSSSAVGHQVDGGRFDDDDGYRASHQRAQHGMWSAVAGAYGAPRAQLASISENTAAKIRKQVKAIGGARQASLAYLNGEASDHESAPLFVPFGGESLSDLDRQGVAEALVVVSSTVASRQNAEAAFGDAVQKATRIKLRSTRTRTSTNSATEPPAGTAAMDE